MPAMNLPSPASNPLALIPRIAVAGVVLAVIGAFGAWVSVSVSGIGAAASKNGLDGDGTITLLLALAAGGILAAGYFRPARWQRYAVLVPAALIVLIAVIDVLDVLGTDAGAIDVSVGWGLWATLLGGVLLLADGIRRLRA